MMADFGAPLPIPEIPNAILGAQTITFNAASMSAAMMFQVPRSGILKKVLVRTGTVTVADDLLIRLETVDPSTGFPTGNLYAANATASVALVDTDDNSFFWIPINGSSGISVTKGDIVAMRINNDYVNGNMVVVYAIGNVILNDFPYCATYASGAWTKQKFVPALTLEYDTGIIAAIGCYPCCYPASAQGFSASTNPNTRGNRIKLPFRARALGFWITVDVDGDCSAILFDSDGVTALETVALSPTIRASTAYGVRFVQFSTPRILEKDTFYRFVLKATTATQITMYAIEVADDGALSGLSPFPLGVNDHATTCNGTPNTELSWTQTTTRQFELGLMIDQIDIGGGGGPIVGSSIVRRA